MRASDGRYFEIGNGTPASSTEAALDTVLAGGGGQMWMEPLSPKGAKKVNAIRLEEAQLTGAKTVGTACSFCTIMMEDDGAAIKGAQEQIRVRDIAELALEAL